MNNNVGSKKVILFLVLIKAYPAGSIPLSLQAMSNFKSGIVTVNCKVIRVAQKMMVELIRFFELEAFFSATAVEELF